MVGDARIFVKRHSAFLRDGDPLDFPLTLAHCGGRGGQRECNPMRSPGERFPWSACVRGQCSESPHPEWATGLPKPTLRRFADQCNIVQTWNDCAVARA